MVRSYNLARCLLPASLFLFVYCSTPQQDNSGVQTTKPTEVPAEQGRAYLGIMYVEGAMGVRIAQVFPGSPAEKAGLEVGDVIVTANGYPVLGTYTLNKRILSLNPGDEVSLEILKRDGNRLLKRATLAPLPRKYKEEYEKIP
ncbi:MAG: PDZ domain-containing protein [Leptospiraceae bacterium]|nr:PDZ domain-containing protein [Leptospiraceae bacterium]